jgi:hypothetical protein
MATDDDNIRERVLILGAAGRDYHTFNTTYRTDPRAEVVGFTHAQASCLHAFKYNSNKQQLLRHLWRMLAIASNWTCLHAFWYLEGISGHQQQQSAAHAPAAAAAVWLTAYQRTETIQSGKGSFGPHVGVGPVRSAKYRTSPHCMGLTPQVPVDPPPTAPRPRAAAVVAALCRSLTLRAAGIPTSYQARCTPRGCPYGPRPAWSQ